MNIEESLIELKNYIKDKTNPYFDNYGFATVRAKQIQAIETLLTAYEKEKEKNKELTERVLKLESDKFWDNVVSKSKIKQIIYPTPENEIPIEVQQSEIYKKLLKEVEE